MNSLIKLSVVLSLVSQMSIGAAFAQESSEPKEGSAEKGWHHAKETAKNYFDAASFAVTQAATALEKAKADLDAFLVSKGKPSKMLTREDVVRESLRAEDERFQKDLARHQKAVLDAKKQYLSMLESTLVLARVGKYAGVAITVALGSLSYKMLKRPIKFTDTVVKPSKAPAVQSITASTPAELETIVRTRYSFGRIVGRIIALPALAATVAGGYAVYVIFDSHIDSLINAIQAEKQILEQEAALLQVGS